jgi:hypothetical protein
LDKVFANDLGSALYWAVTKLPRKYLWDCQGYHIEDITPPDVKRKGQSSNPSYAQTLWFAIREVQSTAWATNSQAVPQTPGWKQWLEEALGQAELGNAAWPAVERLRVFVKGGPDDKSLAQQQPTTTSEQGTRNTWEPELSSSVKNDELLGGTGLQSRQALDGNDASVPLSPNTIQGQSERPSLRKGIKVSVKFRRRFLEVIATSCKRRVEAMAASKLSWWPLSAPEDDLKRGYTRIYSKKFVSATHPL